MKKNRRHTELDKHIERNTNVKQFYSVIGKTAAYDALRVSRFTSLF